MDTLQTRFQHIVDSPSVSKIQSVGLVVLLTTLFYLIFTFLALALHDWNPLWFAWIGDKYLELNPEGRLGYDGQFIYYIAGLGGAAAPHLDNVPYRFQRILLPALVRVFSWGSPELIPWLILLVNGLAIVTATYVLARWFKKQRFSPWYALTYSLYVGTFMAYTRDLTEPLALGFAVLGTTSWLSNRRVEGLLFLTLATLTKETMLLFPIGIGCAELMRKEFKWLLMLAASAVPLAVWELFLFSRYGMVPLASGPSLELIPLKGILPHLALEPGRLSSFMLVAIPALLFTVLSFKILYEQRGRSPSGWWLLWNSIFTILLPLNVYDHIMHAGRNAAGLVLSVLLLLPALPKLVRILTLGYWVLPTFVWLVPVLRWAPWLSLV